VAFALMTVLRCLGIVLWGAPHDFFVSSTAQLLGFFGFYILIAGIPVGYFWMTSARLYANQELLARTDALTGLPNRRGLEEHAQREIERTRRQGTELAVLAIDIDHFKRINDQYGHETGDAALRSVACALAAFMRKPDIMARLGGEEFIALLANTNWEDAWVIAERLRMLVEDLHVVTDRYNLRVTASFGIAVLEAEDTFETVLRRADHALYAAKLAGRNRVMTGPETVHP
jgi:diguanylate cyclase (GGDEF)-like protein